MPLQAYPAGYTLGLVKRVLLNRKTIFNKKGEYRLKEGNSNPHRPDETSANGSNEPPSDLEESRR